MRKGEEGAALVMGLFACYILQVEFPSTFVSCVNKHLNLQHSLQEPTRKLPLQNIFHCSLVPRLCPALFPGSAQLSVVCSTENR